MDKLGFILEVTAKPKPLYKQRKRRSTRLNSREKNIQQALDETYKEKNKPIMENSDINNIFNKMSKDIDTLAELDMMAEDIVPITSQISTKENVKNKAKKDKSEEKQEHDPDFFVKRFGPELEMLYSKIDENNKLKRMSKEFLTKLLQQKHKHIKGITDMFSNVANIDNQELSILKELVNVKTKISDLEIKERKEQFSISSKTAAAKGSSADAKADPLSNQKLIFNLFDDLQNLTTPTKDFVDSLGTISEEDLMVDTELQSTINGLVKAGEISFTDEDKNIQYEKSGAKLFIKLNQGNQEWELLAKDKYGNIIDNYVLPPKESLGKVTFDTDELKATDEFGRSYELLPVNL